MHKVKCKTGLWHASQWPLHARVKILQAFLQPYIMYYLLLLDLKKCHIKDFECLLKNFLWEKKHSRALVLSSWDFVCQPRTNGGLGILNLHSHTIARQAAFIMLITSPHNLLWFDIFWKIIENAEVRFKATWKVDDWNKFFSHAPLYSSSPTLNFLLRSFKSAMLYLKWNGRQRYVGNSFASLSPYWSFLSNPPIAHSLGAATRYLNNKGIDSIGKCYDSKWDLLSFPLVKRKYSVGPAYRSAWVQLSHFLHQFQIPLSIDASDP
ncbi:hypothetical protein KP509_11G070100 [Ceratopteris richardii]|uniref:Uncharacterized protein n=1 Tax=Ceratopteris richardii TaxID=49495 RepID=A0A8T2TVS9_CERRI|nr:hypothetical protein KP509_11G070100 [Ceratopteris richardii]